MKMRKITAFFTAIVAILATFSFLAPAAVKADEGSPAVTEYTSDSAFIEGYRSYKSTYVFSRLVDGTQPVDVDLDAYSYTFSYAPVFTDEQIKTITGEDVTDENRADLTEKAQKDYSGTKLKVETEKSGVNYVLKKGSGSSIVFKTAGEYKATLYRTPKSSDAEDKSEKEFAVVKFETVSSSDASLSFTIEYYNRSYKGYVEKLAAAAKEVKFGDDLRIPELRDLLKVDYFDYADLDQTLFYTTPTSSSFSKRTTTKEIELSNIGKYSYFMTFADRFGKSSITVDLPSDSKVEAGVIKYYDSDDEVKYVRKTVDLALTAEEIESGKYNGVTVEELYEMNEGSEQFVCPIFTFAYDNVSSIDYSVEDEGDVPNAYYNLTYKSVDNLITITAAGDKTTKYRLYFSDKNLSNGSADWQRDYATALIAAADGKTYNEKNSSKNSGVYDVTEVKAFAFDTSTRYFNVAAKGYYYVVCEVGNEWGDTAFCTYAINGNNEFNRVKYVRDWGMFLKNNTLSVVFLGIAVLSFIGLIVVICIKPKEAGADGDVTPKSKG